MWRRALLPLVCLVLCWGCEAERSTVLIELLTDAVAGVEFDGVEVDRLNGPAPEPDVEVIERVQINIENGPNYTEGQIVAQFDLPATPGTPVQLRTSLLVGEARIQIRPTTALVRQNSTVQVIMTRDCRGVSCPGDGDSPTDLACLGGRCVDYRCTPETPEFCGGRDCEVGADCEDSGVTCANAFCSNGACLYADTEGVCNDGEYCDRTMGCSPIPESPLGDTGTGPSPEECESDDACTERDGAEASCNEGRCNYVCEDGFGDCDERGANGCETELDTITNCGGCGFACSRNNTSPECDEGECDVSACSEGFVDCDGIASNGCEIEVTSDTQHCGDCDAVCAPAGALPICSDSECSYTECLPGFADCNDEPSDACEVDTRSDANHCGLCGATCESGVCASGICDPPFERIVLGRAHACGMSAGRVWCWGETGRGQHGVGHTSPTWVAAVDPITTLEGVSLIEAGANHTCVVMDGAIHCWGLNAAGQAGASPSEAELVPVSISSALPGAPTALAGGQEHTCALVGTEVYCWGDNTFGQMGNGSTTPLPSPGEAVGPVVTDIRALAVGDGYHSCALRPNGEVLCWGSNEQRQSGNPLSPSPVTTPRAVGLPMPAIAVSVGREHSCAVLNDNTVRCWGRGLLGNGSESTSASPVAVMGLSGVIDIVCGRGFSCALGNTGEVTCWGEGDQGELGDGAMQDRAVPGPSVPGGPYERIDAYLGVCARRTGDGRFVCWGRNDGNLGSGAVGPAALPVEVTPPT